MLNAEKDKAMPPQRKEPRTGPRKRYVCHEVVSQSNQAIGLVKPRVRYDSEYYIAFRGFDKDKGIEITWHQFKVSSFSTTQLAELLLEIDVLKRLNHPCVLSIKDGWFDDKLNLVVIITDIISSGTCIQAFLEKVSSTGKLLTPDKVMRRWAYQLCSGLKYLHEHDPPVHTNGNFVCGNIYMNGNKGDIKIGVFGMIKSLKIFGISKNNYIAPEMVSQLASEGFCEPDALTDIYVLGTCVLELVTREVSYLELQDDRKKIYNHIVEKIYPASFSRLPDGFIRDFILRCWKDRSVRPSPADLVNDPWFDKIEDSVLRRPEQTSRLKKAHSEPICFTPEVVDSVSKAPAMLSSRSKSIEESSCQSMSSLSNSSTDIVSMLSLLMNAGPDSLMPSSSNVSPTDLIHLSIESTPTTENILGNSNPPKKSTVEEHTILSPGRTYLCRRNSEELNANRIDEFDNSIPMLTLERISTQSLPLFLPQLQMECEPTSPLTNAGNMINEKRKIPSPIKSPSKILHTDDNNILKISNILTESVAVDKNVISVQSETITIKIALLVDEMQYEFEFPFNLELDKAKDIVEEFSSQEMGDFFGVDSPSAMFSIEEKVKLIESIDQVVNEVKMGREKERLSKSMNEKKKKINVSDLSFAA